MGRRLQDLVCTPSLLVIFLMATANDQAVRLAAADS